MERDRNLADRKDVRARSARRAARPPRFGGRLAACLTATALLLAVGAAISSAAGTANTDRGAPGPGARSPAVRHGLTLDRSTSAQPSPWFRPMEGLYGDRVTSVVFVGDGSQGTRSMLMLSRGGGAFRLTPTGAWDPVSVADSPRRDLVLALIPKVNDIDKRTVYAGLGRPLPLFARSDDYGVTWTSFPGPSGPRRFDLIASCRSGRLYAAESDSQQIVWTSDDGGQTWASNSALPAGKPIHSLATAPDESYVYAIAGTTLYRSADKPAQWEAVLGPATADAAAVLLVDAGTRGRLYASAKIGDQLVVLSSDDRGATWPSRGWPTTNTGAPSAMASGEVEGLGAVWLGHTNGRIYRSTDGGATWTPEGRLTVPSLAIEQDDETAALWVGSDGLGLYRLTPSLAHTGAMPLESLAVVSPDFGDDGMAIVNALVMPEQRDILGNVIPARYALFESTDGERWGRKTITTGLGTNLLASPAFASDGRLFSGDLMSSDAGVRWREMSEAPGGGVPHILAVGPITGTRPVLYGLREPYTDGAGGRGLVRSETGGTRWEDTEGPQSGIVAAAISPDYPRDRTVYVATDLGFIYEALDGLNFLQVGRIPAFNPVRNLYALAMSPDFANDRTLVAAIDDPSQPQTRAHVYISTKAGRGLWQDRSQGLDPTSHPRSLELSPFFHLDGVSFVGTVTDGGLAAVYGATGDAWFPDLLTGGPAQVNDMSWGGSLDDGWLFAAAGVAGLWVRRLEGPPEPPATATGTPGGPTATATRTATPVDTARPTDTMPPETASPTSVPSASATATAEPVSTETPTPTELSPSATAPITSTPSPSATADEGPGPIYLPFLQRAK